MAKRSKFTFESNLKVIEEKIADKPHRVLNTIGSSLVREARPDVPKRPNGGRLRLSIGYWARKKEKDLQLGYKQFYAPFVLTLENEPLYKAVMKNKDEIVRLIGEALDQIRKER